MERNNEKRYQEFIASANARLGVPDSFLRNMKLPIETEPSDLKSIGFDVYGRRQWLAPHVMLPLKQLLFAAKKEGVQIGIVSAFRSVQYQFFLIQGKLSRGIAIEDILQSSAPPGHSEHHSGEALDFVDLASHPHSTLDDQFENTMAFSWLEKKAQHYGFAMSFPRGNEYGIVYEPWHWRFRSNYKS